jgi:hypothetical protein
MKKHDIPEALYLQSHQKLHRAMCALDRTMAELAPSQRSELEQCFLLRTRLEAAHTAILSFNRVPQVRNEVLNDVEEEGESSGIMISTSSRRRGRKTGEALSTVKVNAQPAIRSEALSTGCMQPASQPVPSQPCAHGPDCSWPLGVAVSVSLPFSCMDWTVAHG